MFSYPKNLYTDVRIENVFETNISFTQKQLDDLKVKNNQGAFIRVFDGECWYLSSVSSSKTTIIQKEIQLLSTMANENVNIDKCPVVRQFETNTDCILRFRNNDIKNVSKEQKMDLLKRHFPSSKHRNYLKNWKMLYSDRKVTKKFYSSRGASLVYDQQNVGFMIDLYYSNKKKIFFERYQKGGELFQDLLECDDDIERYLDKCENFFLNAIPVKSGNYPIILSPMASGVFAHEIFGHNSEADIILGSSNVTKENWALGKKIGSDKLTIVDDGTIPGSGYVPYDDEGTRAKRTYLLKNGILSGRLHNTTTASIFNEDLSGNARALNFEYEPIVRMTNTIILAGDQSKDDLFADVENGIYVESLYGGSGLSTFSLEPSLSYYVINGKISKPVIISLITGKVTDVLNSIDSVSSQSQIFSLVGAGCGKGDQFPLPIGFGGPFIKIRELSVQ